MCPSLRGQIGRLLRSPRAIRVPGLRAASYRSAFGQERQRALQVSPGKALRTGASTGLEGPGDRKDRGRGQRGPELEKGQEPQEAAAHDLGTCGPGAGGRGGARGAARTPPAGLDPARPVPPGGAAQTMLASALSLFRYHARSPRARRRPGPSARESRERGSRASSPWTSASGRRRPAPRPPCTRAHPAGEGEASGEPRGSTDTVQPAAWGRGAATAARQGEGGYRPRPTSGSSLPGPYEVPLQPCHLKTKLKG